MITMCTEDLREFLKPYEDGNPKKDGQLVAKIMEVIDNVNGGCDLSAALSDKDAEKWYYAYKEHEKQEEKRRERYNKENGWSFRGWSWK
ncbi:hypothetical protein [Helicobacter suis]|uniref:hypothetical protein n=1 Tax=Helicobacter suis TaxID=104628 RepID=UPI0013D56689|nr:hypothetical protein [Helicobacter suis]